MALIGTNVPRLHNLLKTQKCCLFYIQSLSPLVEMIKEPLAQSNKINYNFLYGSFWFHEYTNERK